MIVAVIEDRTTDQEHLVSILRKDHYEVLAFNEGLSALHYFQQDRADVILIDYHMPGGPNGLTVARQIRKMHPASVIIMTTSYADIDFVIEAMQIGLDDYIIKPFRAEVVLKRISEAIGRRQDWFPTTEIIPVSGPLAIDLETHRVHWHGERIELTMTEFNLLRLLASRPGHVFTYSELYALHRGERVEPVVARARLKTHLANLKDKLDRGLYPDTLEKVRGIGVRWVPTTS
ncbi:MAG: response regulator transcription factor [Anaerolineae bacterium]|nr:response regulator transcription factor [Anaerolineae bacterium]